MSYTLEEFAADCRNALKDGESAEAFEAVRQYVEKALKDHNFINTHVPENTTEPRRIILMTMDPRGQYMAKPRARQR